MRYGGGGDLELNEFDARLATAGDFDGSAWHVEMLGEKFDEGIVGLAIVRFGAQINSKLAAAGCDNLLFGRTGFDGDLIYRHSYIISCAAAGVVGNELGGGGVTELRKFWEKR